MSLINDALKRAQQSSHPVSAKISPAPASAAPTDNAVSKPSKLIPALFVVLAVAGIGLVSLAMLHPSARRTAPLPTPPPAKILPAVAPVHPAIAKPLPARATLPSLPTIASLPKAKPRPVSAPPKLPKLQGIFYSPTSPAAIINGRTVRPGDRILHYDVVAIGRQTVTLKNSGGKLFKLSLGH